jgi:phospholipid/cholesterol/gamma-HCH transport system substrate-binding protein
MEREANYILVGTFVLAIVLAAAGFVYWYSDSSEHREYHRYEIYFTGSVSGLDKGGAVRYLGVGVGRVVELHIDPRDSGRVEVIVDIGGDTPISEHTVAQLQLQGVTGLLYIDLMDDRTGKHAAPAIAGLKYPVIRSSPSQFDVFLSSLPELVADAGEVVRRANQLFSDANLNAIAGALSGIETAARGLPQTSRDLSALVVELRGATAELAAAAKGAHTLIGNTSPDIEAATQRLHVIADHLADASGQIDGLLHDNRADIRAFARDGLPELQRFLREGRAAAEDIRALANSLREDPAQLLYEPPQRGMEIPR